MSKPAPTADKAWENGKQFFKDGVWDKAEEAFSDALKEVRNEDGAVDLKYVQLMLDLAELLILKERKSDCKTLLNETIELLEKSYPDEKSLLLDASLAYVDALSMCDQFEDANPYIVKALELSDTPEGLKNGKYVQALATRAAGYLAQEEFENAEPVIEEALEVCTANSITEGEAVCVTMLLKGLYLHLSGQLEESENVFRKAIESVAKDDYSRSFQDVCFGFTTLLISQSRFPDAISFLNEEIDRREKKTCRDHPLLKRAITSLAVANAAYGDLDEAEVQAQRYLRLVESMGNAGSELRIDCLRCLIDILVEQSRYPEVEVLLNRANDILENVADDYIKANLISDLARLKVELGQYEEAERLCTRALALTRQMKGDDHLETAMCLSILGSAYFSNRKIKEAEEAYREAIALIEQHHHFFTSFVGAENYRNLGIILTQIGKHEEAEEMFLKILAFHAKNPGSLKVQVAETHRNLGELYEVQNKNHEALNQYELAFKIAENIYGPENNELSDYICYLADIHRKQHRFDEAETLYKQALSILENTLGPQHPKTCTLLQRFGEMAIEKGEYANAEQYFNSALLRLEQTLGTIHPEIGYTCYCLGAAYHWQEKLPQAEKCYKRALEIKEKQLGPNHKDLANIIEPLIDILNHQGRSTEASALHRRMNELSSYDASK